MGLNAPIEELIQWDLPAAQYSESIESVVQKMRQNRVSSLLVKNGDRVVGVISDTDILGILLKGTGGGDTQACEVMTSCEVINDESTENPCVQLDAAEPVINALKVLEISGTHGLVVSKASESSVVGVVCLRDLLAKALKVD